MRPRSGRRSVWPRGALLTFIIGSIVLAGDVGEARAAGTLMGTISQVGSGTGIAGATVIADDGITPQSTTTGGSGDYSFSLPAGTYTVTAKAAGFLPDSVTGVVVLDTTITTQDIVLSAVPAAPAGSELQVNTYTTGFQGPAAVARDANGFVVVWRSGPGLMAQRFDSLGAKLGTEIQADTPTLGSAFIPDVAADGSGGFMDLRSLQRRERKRSGRSCPAA